MVKEWYQFAFGLRKKNPTEIDANLFIQYRTLHRPTWLVFEAIRRTYKDTSFFIPVLHYSRVSSRGHRVTGHKR
jgi:hypothetical protein